MDGQGNKSTRRAGSAPSGAGSVQQDNGGEYFKCNGRSVRPMTTPTFARRVESNRVRRVGNKAEEINTDGHRKLRRRQIPRRVVARTEPTALQARALIRRLATTMAGIYPTTTTFGWRGGPGLNRRRGKYRRQPRTDQYQDEGGPEHHCLFYPSHNVCQVANVHKAAGLYWFLSAIHTAPALSSRAMPSRRFR